MLPLIAAHRARQPFPSAQPAAGAPASSAARLLLALLLLTDTGIAAAQQPDSTPSPKLSVQAFADAYYGWDTGRPPLRDRALTTQAVRHSEFNVNLAHLAVKLDGDRVRGRLAVQAGTSVQANYAGEPAVGAFSGPSLSRNVQEATAGVRLAPGLWADAGIYFSPIGHEGWISADNPTYTRSLTAEFTPYYLAGAKLTWTASPAVVLQAHVVNGWQKISDDDDGKALVVRGDWTRGRTTLSVTGFAGNERAASADATESPHTRLFGQLLLKSAFDPRTTLWLSADLGRQSRETSASATWGSLTGTLQRTLSPSTAIAFRAERYIDRQGAVLLANGAGAAITGLSANVDVRVPGGAIWRSETRWQRADRAVFPDRTGSRRTNVLLVTSLAFAIDRLLGAAPPS